MVPVIIKIDEPIPSERPKHCNLRIPKFSYVDDVRRSKLYKERRKSNNYNGIITLPAQSSHNHLNNGYVYTEADLKKNTK